MPLYGVQRKGVDFQGSMEANVKIIKTKED